MNKHDRVHKILGIIFIIVGIILYPTPIPGTTLLLIFGLVFLFGKKKTLHLLKDHLNKKVFKYLKINKIIKKL